MAANPADVLTIVKDRLGIADQSSDTLISSYIDEMGPKILHYCNIEEVPDGLKYVWASMVIDLLKVRNPQMPVIATLLGTTIEVKVGDTSTKTTPNKASVPAIVLSYADDLNHYRKLRW